MSSRSLNIISASLQTISNLIKVIKKKIGLEYIKKYKKEKKTRSDILYLELLKSFYTSYDVVLKEHKKIIIQFIVHPNIDISGISYIFDVVSHIHNCIRQNQLITKNIYVFNFLQKILIINSLIIDKKCIITFYINYYVFSLQDEMERHKENKTTLIQDLFC
jgi:hypothetical protein